MVTLNIQKKHILFLSAILLSIGIGFVIAYGSGNSTLHGHDSGEVESVGFGDWETRSFGTVYTASTDGFAVAWTSGIRNDLIGYTPDGIVRQQEDDDWGETPKSITMPVKKGDTWRVTRQNSIGNLYWIPFGS